MKINSNRDYEAMQAEGYYSAEYKKGDIPAFDMGSCDNMMGEAIAPIYECPKETVCHRYICHEVPHIMPCNTRIINHHIYRHTYTPTYSCCEENDVQNVYERRCC